MHHSHMAKIPSSQLVVCCCAVQTCGYTRVKMKEHLHDLIRCGSTAGGQGLAMQAVAALSADKARTDNRNGCPSVDATQKMKQVGFLPACSSRGFESDAHARCTKTWACHMTPESHGNEQTGVGIPQ